MPEQLSDPHFAIRSTVFCVLVLAPFIVYFAARRRTPLLLDPVTYVFLVTLLSVGVKTVAVMAFKERILADDLLHLMILGHKTTRILDLGYWANLLFVYSFFGGLLVSRRVRGSVIRNGSLREAITRIRLRLDEELASPALPTILWCALLLTLAAFVYAVATHVEITSLADLSAKRFLTESREANPYRFYSGRYALFKIAGLSKVVCIVSLGAGLLGTRRPVLLMIGVAALLAFDGVAVVFSLRAHLLLLCIEVSVLLALARPARWRLIISGLVLLTIGVNGFVTASRLRPAPPPSASAAEKGGGRPTPRLELVSKDMLARLSTSRSFSDISKLSVLIDRWHDEGPWLYGETLYSWVTVPLGDRPNMTFAELGRFLGSNIFGAKRSGVTPGFVGELYVNFSWPGIPVGGFVLGAIALFCQRALRQGDRAPLGDVVFALSMPKLFFLLSNGTLGSTALNLLFDMGGLALILGLAAIVGAWPGRGRAQRPDGGPTTNRQ